MSVSLASRQFSVGKYHVLVFSPAHWDKTLSGNICAYRELRFSIRAEVDLEKLEVAISNPAGDDDVVLATEVLDAS